MGLNQNILFLWISWQFFDVPKQILKAWRNFLLFNLNYFSIPALIRTLFSYWRQYRWYYPRGLDIGGFLTTLFSNMMSRTIGATLRVFLVIFGGLVEIFILFAGLVVFLTWIIMPVILVLGIYHGFRILF